MTAKHLFVILGCVLLTITAGAQQRTAPKFHVEEATISDIQGAITSNRITTVGTVESYLKRIKAYNGTCVNQPMGILGPVTTIPHARQINALSTINLRPTARKEWGFDDRKARSMTDPADNKPNMPDALEVAAAQDRQFQRTGKLVGPLHGVVMAIKDQYDTFDLRTTAGADAAYANDRPPQDATFVKRLRDAGAIILAKANLAEYATDGARSSFGGTFCNPYDTEREPGMSSAGSGSSVAANLVTCAIGEETVVSVRWPAAVNSIVGLAPTKELVSTAGMIGAGVNMRVGPMCRTVADTAKVLDAIAGYDPKDPYTARSIGRTPTTTYLDATSARTLNGVRIGVVREYLNRRLLAQADTESVDIAERAIDVLKKLGATVVDPGPEGALFQQCITRAAPELLSSAFTDGLTLQSIGGGFNVTGEDKYMMNRYLRERGDANIKTNADLIEKGTFYDDPNFPNRRNARVAAERATTFDTSARMHTRFATQTLLSQCMAEQKLDALVSPMSTVPPRKLLSPREPPSNGRTP